MEMNPGNFSFYLDAQAFTDFHAYTSYYRAGQQALVELIQAKPGDLIIELGCAIGDTTRAIARRYPGAQVLGVDFREEMIQEAQRLSQDLGVTNTRFLSANMTDLAAYLPWQGNYPQVLCSLYSFHHIPDPIANKYAFAQEVAALNTDSLRVVIMDEVVPVPSDDPGYAEATLQQWNAIAQEAYRSVFLNRYLELLNQGLSSEQAQEQADIAASYTADIERTLGQTTAQRLDEYPITTGQMMDLWIDAGFAVEFQTKLNTLGDHLFVFRR